MSTTKAKPQPKTYIVSGLTAKLTGPKSARARKARATASCRAKTQKCPRCSHLVALGSMRLHLIQHHRSIDDRRTSLSEHHNPECQVTAFQGGAPGLGKKA